MECWNEKDTNDAVRDGVKGFCSKSGGIAAGAVAGYAASALTATAPTAVASTTAASLLLSIETGAAVGSSFPVVGTAIGAAVGLGAAILPGTSHKSNLKERYKKQDSVHERYPVFFESMLSLYSCRFQKKDPPAGAS